MIASFVHDAWFVNGANLWQWTTSIVALAGWSLAARVFWAHRCNICHVRPGSHPVKGTTYRVCHRHHLADAHLVLRARHGDRHPERLGHGESPGSGRSQASRRLRGTGVDLAAARGRGKPPGPPADASNHTT